ncbi:Uncharacterized protein PECH_006974 [Penicillium ucsense]|uniref:F-box domain-containing protein n=1 Tax=Penicillium ucsense TaxID=2839758 RepID=A0A8J8WKP4_9EURO|nr:Uncharacterized protein PECM_005054 [Penicillium ucsense]KAF7739012.1 Uncharacterized protein PECH_006974 [Penicillium ucsense]
MADPGLSDEQPVDDRGPQELGATDEISTGSRVNHVFQKASIIDRLPPELIHQILSYLSARDLANVSATCRVLAEHGSDDGHWSCLVNSHLPAAINDPGPFPSFRRLYLAHQPYWFIPQNKIWISDTDAVGGLILARYDHRRGVIEAYRLVAERPRPGFHLWTGRPDVMILSFDPAVSLWLDAPVLFLKDERPSDAVTACQTWDPDRRMPMVGEERRVISSLMLCPKESTESEAQVDPSRFWPSHLIPASEHLSRATHSTVPKLPSCLSQTSTAGFRVKRWAKFRLIPTDSVSISTYATINPELYTPTAEKPYQGIWVGDYSAHGCEFLLIYQEFQPALPYVGSDTDSDVFTMRNTLRAVKLTGDPNVPRGELTFCANDIGPRGLIRIADEEPFAGARIVRSYGQVAGINFRNASYTASQLILISTSYIAHFWQEMGHVSYLRRVDIDALLKI